MRARINTKMQLAPPATRPDPMSLIQPLVGDSDIDMEHRGDRA
jgi:hypothetical protein